ncbi:MAG: TonB-dependent receptor [Roseibium sp.]
MHNRVRLSMLLAGTVLQSAILMVGASAQDAQSEVASSEDESRLETIHVSSGAPDTHDKHQGSADRVNSLYISREQIERTDPQTVRDLFAGDAAISVGGATTAAQKVFVNGIDENNLAVTVDGVQQGNRIFHHTNTNYIDPALLKAVRVDPGVAPADAGFAALGGAIAYETVDVPDLLIVGRNFGAFANMSYETNGKTAAGTVAGYGRHEGFELLGYSKIAKGETYKNGNGFATPGTATDFQSFLGKGAYELGSGHRLEFTGQHVIDETLRPYRANIGAINNSFTTRLYDLRRTNISAQFKKDEIEGFWNPEALIGFSQNNYKVPHPEGSEGLGGTLNAKIENVFELSEVNTVTAGLDLISKDGAYKDPKSYYKEQLTNLGGYAQARLSPIDRINLSFGGRADGNYFEGMDGTQINNFGLSGNAFAEVDVYGGVSVNAGYSNVFGGVELEETFEFWRKYDYSNLKPSRSDNMTAGVKFEHDGWTAESNIFNTRFWNYRDGAGNTDFSSWGFNVSGGFNWGSGFAKLSYSDVRLNLADHKLESYRLINIGAGTGRKFSGEIAHTFEQYDLTVGAILDAALEFDGFQNAGYDAFDPYTVVSAYAEYKPEKFEFMSVRLNVDNIFDETYADRATYGQEYASVTPLYEPGRSFRLSANFRY